MLSWNTWATYTKLKVKNMPLVIEKKVKFINVPIDDQDKSEESTWQIDSVYKKTECDCSNGLMDYILQAIKIR